MVGYTGGKVRLAPKITKHLEKDLQELNCKGVYPIYWEPFFGAGSVMASLDTGKVLLPVGSDINKGLMRLWRDDEVMPSTVSKEDYYAVKAVDKHRDFETALGAFVGILCSYEGMPVINQVLIMLISNGVVYRNYEKFFVRRMYFLSAAIIETC